MASPADTQALYTEALKFLLRPFVRFCLQRSLSIQDFLKAARVVFVEMAAEEMRKTTQKVNVSRLSVMTGIYRRDVVRIFRENKTPTDQRLSILGRVIGQWRHDERFIGKGGVPRVLTYKGEDSEFRELVRKVSTSVNPGTVQFELERIGTVVRTKQGLELRRQMPGLAADPKKGLELLSKDMESLIEAVDENLLDRSKVGNLHIRTEYDNIFYEDLPKIREWLIEEGKAFHRRAREFFSKFDKDIFPGSRNDRAGAQVILTAFSLTSPLAEDKQDEAGAGDSDQLLNA